MNRPLIEAWRADSARLRAVKQEWSSRLLDSVRSFGLAPGGVAAGPAPQQNVVGVGIGEKQTAGKATGMLAVKFFVEVKYPVGAIGSRERLPERIDGLPTDVEQVGRFRRLRNPPEPPPRRMPNPRRRRRPAQPGASIGFRHPQDQYRMAGTFGALTRRKKELFVLSNNHVLADENRLPLGSPIFQPGLLDKGDPKTDTIAHLSKAVKLRNGVFNRVDAAIARVSDPASVSNAILLVGPPAGTAQAALDMIVHKFGRTTAYSAGRITSIDTDVFVEYETGRYSFRDQIVVVSLDGTSFSEGGDSGSLILERATQKAVGLLFAGSFTHTLANPIRTVLRALRVGLDRQKPRA